MGLRWVKSLFNYTSPAEIKNFFWKGVLERKQRQIKHDRCRTAWKRGKCLISCVNINNVKPAGSWVRPVKMLMKQNKASY